MFGLTIPFAIEATRRNPIRTPTRNLVASQGDDLILAITVYAADGSLVNLNGAAVTVTVQRDAWGHPGACDYYDYGLGWLTLADPVIWTNAGVVVYSETGLATVTIPQSVTANWWGRFRLFIALDGTDAGCVTADGVLDVRRCAVRPRPVLPPIIGGDFASSDFSTGDFYTGVATPNSPVTGAQNGGNDLFLLGILSN